MFSKIAHKLKYSITVRLAVLFTIFSVSLLVLISFGVFFVTSWQLTQEDRKSLNDFASLMKADLARESTSPEQLKQYLSQEVSAFHYHRYQIRLVQVGKTRQSEPTVVFQSKDFPTFLLHKKLKEQDFILNNSETFRAKPSTYYIMTGINAFVGKAPTVPVIAYISLNVSQRVAFLSQLKETLIWFVSLGGILFCLSSIFLIRRGFRQIWQFSRKIQSITLHNLHTRVNNAHWYDEVRPLAVSFDNLIERLEQGVNQLNHFSSDLAHELKTPITNLRVEIEVLLEKERQVPDYQATLKNNLEELERLSNMIERLLILARMDNAAFILCLEEIQLAPVVEKLLGYFEIIAQEKNIDLTQHGDTVIVADKALVKLALSNLISNAVKYTPSGGKIQVELGKETSNKAFIRIVDNGNGIPEEQQAFVFDRFYRGDPSRSQQIPGDGLGLAIVKAIMTAHKGKITLTSTLQKGSTFSLLFPTK
jgi:two-component system, OmpR family, heavy metal sensor histidine kinase CusS